jgi:hypothetical protein
MSAGRAGKPRLEHGIQNDVRNALCDVGMFFRANVGTAWAGNDVTKLVDGSILIRDPRPFSSGLPAGFHDLFGAVPVTITPEMVGQTFALFTTIECKSAKGKARERQVAFAGAVERLGGRTGFARSVQDALNVANGDLASQGGHHARR